MTALASDLRTYAVKRWPTMNHEWRKAKLASMLGMKARRIRSYWDGEENMSARVSEVDAIKALIGVQEEAANAEAYREMDARFSAMETELAELRAEIAAASLVGEGPSDRRPGRGPDRERQGIRGRRSTDH